MMSIDQLRKNLASLYTLKCFADLADLTDSPTSAYKQFESCYQEVFDNQDRLVFYTTEVISHSLLQHLYQAANLIDVSNCFVLICSPHNVEQPINIDLFQTLQVSFESTNKLQTHFFVPDTLCPMPWRHVEVSSIGEVRPCCTYADSVAYVKNGSLTSAFTNTAFQTLRQDLLDGKKSSGCNKCWDAERNGLTSNRQYHMSLLKKELLTTDLDFPRIQSVDIKPGNTCNFKCRICGPESSSLYAQEVKLFKADSIESFNWAESTSNTIKEIVELLPTLTNIDLYGGEPFLIKPLSYVVKQAVEQGRAEQL